MKTKLDNIAKISIGALISRFSKRYEGPKEEKEVLYYKGKELYTETEEIATDIDDRFLTHKGDIIIRLAEPQFAANVDGENIAEGIVISSKFAIIKPYRDINPEFLATLLNSNIVKNQFNKYSEGSAIKQIKVKDLGRIQLTIPTEDEQNDYVEYIILINKEIELYKKLIAEHEDLLEGVLEKSQGGE